MTLDPLQLVLTYEMRVVDVQVIRKKQGPPGQVMWHTMG